ncbi:MAG TPA: NAD-dependent epimerase/dehydratase family protein [Bryobacteraceae bacterium]|nr:NAD-dependent epimerase/dehydratase family protein [Bryobacteraceae bacterium]
MNGRILVTGGAGFIGSHLVDRLLADGYKVTTVDNFDAFYCRSQKEANISAHLKHPAFRLVECDIRNRKAVSRAASGSFDCIVHLAAKAGVRPSLEDPDSYVDVNLRGTQNLLELARRRSIEQFVFASSSSVYGVNPKVPWDEDEAGLRPISPYAATKVAGELQGHVYAHVFGLRFIGLRFFTVYGPRQRPDLAIHKFARLITEGKEIPVFGDGSSRRDYTYVDDIVAGIVAAIGYRRTRYEIINLGNSHPTGLLELIGLLECALDVKARLKFVPAQPGDVPQTFASVSKAAALLVYAPHTPMQDGLQQFASWFRSSRGQ